MTPSRRKPLLHRRQAVSEIFISTQRGPEIGNFAVAFLFQVCVEVCGWSH
jgi:hypothetical protein